MAYAFVHKPPPVYAGAWPAYATFGIRTQDAAQKPLFSLLLLSHFIFLSYMFLFKFLLCICVSDAFVSHVLLLFTFDMLD